MAAEDEFAQAVAMLEEACAYLNSLPPHPMTADMVRRVRSHLEAPAHRVELERRRLAALDMSGGNYTPAGVPVIKARVLGPVLRLSAPELVRQRVDRFDALLLTRMRSGEVIPLGYRNYDGAWQNPEFLP